MAGSELLIRHAAKWAEKRSAPFDADLLETALELRSLHDGLAANRWPEGSVEHLMLERWPAHGPSGVPDVDALVATLESFWKFLSNTGRMARGSADPRVLRAEARRAEGEMTAAAADTGRHSQGKVLQEFGREIGISLDEAESMEDLQDRLDRVAEAWNNLPQEERFRRSPGKPRLDDDDGGVLLPADPELSAPQWLGSAFCRSLIAFAQWVGDGREVTATGQLRPAVAREAYRELDLWEWERGWWRIGHDEVLDPEADEIMREVSATSWRSAGDSPALARLWSTLVATGLVEVRSKRAVVGRAIPTAPAEEVVEFGLMALAYLVLSLRETLDMTCLGFVIFSIALDDGPPPTRDGLIEAWWTSPANPMNRAEFSEETRRILRRISDDEVRRCLEIFCDCGLWVEDEGTLVGTEFGWDFALILTRLFESGILDEA
jgi:hypothetical protein